MKIKGTVSEISSNHKFNGVEIDQLNLSIFLKILESLGLAKIVNKQAPKGGKGKPSNVWEVSRDISITATSSYAD